VIYRTDEDALTREIVALASEYGRYGCRRITALLRDHGWHVGKDRVQRNLSGTTSQWPLIQATGGEEGIADSLQSTDERQNSKLVKKENDRIR
jgi:hypothetical protein